jgi:hypothetical protein
MKKIMVIGMVMLIMVLTPVSAVFAASGQPPVGTCQPGFEIHEIGNHDGGDHMHHIGIAADLNGDGLICVKHLPNGLHVHMDNVIREN